VPGPRIAPGSPREIGRINTGIAGLIGRATGGPPPNVFTTLARHRGMFRKWLRFAGSLMPGGVLPRAESELLILRVAHNTGSAYEWGQHERIARSEGLTAEEVQRVREGPGADGWSERQALLLSAADELHAERMISDALWSRLSAILSDVELIELCMLVGHYEMLAMTLNSLRVEPDAPGDRPPPAALRRLRALSRSRRRT
jgi:alkylhydroperoxidase family enzyme